MTSTPTFPPAQVASATESRPVTLRGDGSRPAGSRTPPTRDSAGTSAADTLLDAAHINSARGTVRREIQGADQQAYDSVSRLISETAHDLRAPISTIREAVRLVRDGDLGQVSMDQQECLSAAINQCNCAVQLVEEMVQSRRFDTGFPNVQRQWFLIDDLRRSVEETLQPWVMPRGIHLLWDGPFDRNAKIFGDATLLRRLIVNLAGNAIRVTREGGAVLIRAKAGSQPGKMVWSVVDQGHGISPSDMELIAAGRAPAKSVGGLGLMICRQLAVAHFSPLKIESRQGTGTAVSFEVPTGGPAAVASRWSQWRSGLDVSTEVGLRPETHRVREMFPASPSADGQIAPPRRVRIDVPAQSVELGPSDVLPAFASQVALATVSVGAATAASGTNAFDVLLQRSMRITELAYRTGRRSWVIAWDADAETAVAKRIELERLARNELDSIRLTWGECHVANTNGFFQDGISLASRLSDLMVRQTLAAAQHTVSDSDQVRLGTTPLMPSSIPTARLEKELRWLYETRR